MNEYTPILCPQCNSNQLTIYKKSISQVKPVDGSIPEGSVDMLQGLTGKQDLIITCLACGHKFLPEQGSPVSPSPPETISNNIPSDLIDKRILETAQKKGKLAAIKFCKDAKGFDLATCKKYVEDLIDANGISTGGMTGRKEGCFIATACYGDYNAMEVMVLRNYRDTVLQHHLLGRVFIKCYYFFSPAFANAIDRSDYVKSVIRRTVLKPIVAYLKKQCENK